VIPIHSLSTHPAKAIRVHALNELTRYDISEPHRHNYFEFFVFEKGGGVHMIDFVDFPIESNSIHIVAPGQVHMVKRELDSKGHVLLFETDVFEANHFVTNFLFDHICFGLDEFPPTYQFDAAKQKEIASTMEQIWKDYQSDAPLKNEFVMSHLTVLLIHCMRSREGSHSVDLPRSQKIYAGFRRLLQNNFKTIKKVKDYALALSVTEKQLNEIIQARTGLSPSAVIHNQLVLEARRLLKTGMLAKEVAYELNFDDPAHFSKFFKTHTGLSPGDFQKIQD
jgi:AraC family transcriptional regulator, transcriptional activator of pobA